MKMTAARATIALWMCLFAATSSWAQSRKPAKLRASGAFCGTVYAGVTPQFSRPFENSDIDLMPAKGGVAIAHATTDAHGVFKFSNLPRGVYRVGREGLKTTEDTIEVTTADQRDCTQPLFVILYVHPMEETGLLQSRIVAKLPLNFANAFKEVSTKERQAAEAEVRAGVEAGNDLDLVEQHNRAAVRLDPTYWLPHLNLAVVLVERKQVAAAEAEYREAVRVGRTREAPYWHLTTFLVDHNRLADAESALIQARKDGIESAGVSASFGLVAYQKHQWKEAEKQFRAAFEFTPEPLIGFPHWEQWEAFLAVALSRQGKSREFKAQYRAALESSDDPWLLNLIGYELVERGEHLDEAARMLEQAVAASPGNAQMLDSLGWANVKLRRFAVAEPLLKQAAASLPNDPTVLEHLGELYAATGRKDAARSTFEAALEHATDADHRKRLSSRVRQMK